MIIRQAKDFILTLFQPEVRIFSLLGSAILILVAIGIYYHWPEWSAGLTAKEGGTAGNLIAEGLGIFISLIIIAPLTAYFVDVRRQNQLRPAIENLIYSLGEKIEDVAATFEFWSRFHELRVLNLYTSSILAVNRAGHRNMHILLEKLEKLNTLDSKLITGDDRQEKIFTPTLESDIILGASYLADDLRHHMKKMWSDLKSIESQIDILITILQSDSIVHAAKIQTIIQSYISKIYDLDLVINGYSLQTNHASAQLAILEFDKIIKAYHKLEIGCKTTRRHSLEKCYANKSKYTTSHQMSINEKIYYVFEIISRSK